MQFRKHKVEEKERSGLSRLNKQNILKLAERTEVAAFGQKLKGGSDKRTVVGVVESGPHGTRLDVHLVERSWNRKERVVGSSSG